MIRPLAVGLFVAAAVLGSAALPVLAALSVAAVLS